MRKIIFLLVLGGILGLPLFAVILATDRLPAPEQIYPPHNQKGVSTRVEFQWESVEGAEKYDIILWYADTRERAHREVTWYTHHTFDLTEGTTYWWDVRACNATGWFGWDHDCDEQKFDGSWEFTTEGVAPLRITEADPPDGWRGAYYEYTFRASGGVKPYTWEKYAGRLPDGLTLSPDGVLSGIPTKPDAYKFWVKVTDALGESKRTPHVILVIIRTAPLDIITPADLPPGAKDHPYFTQLKAEGGAPPYEWHLLRGDLPDGLHLSPHGEIRGEKAEKEGTFEFEVVVSDDEGRRDYQVFTITIGPPGVPPPDGVAPPPDDPPVAPPDPPEEVEEEPVGIGWIVIENPLEAETLGELIGNIIHFLRDIGVLIAPVLLIVAGFFFVASAGNPAGIQTAKNIILYTLIGLAILIVADVLVDVIIDVLKGNEAQQ